MADQQPQLEPGEKVRREIRSDRGIYWRDHALMGMVVMAIVAIVLLLMQNPFVPIGTLGAGMLVGMRGLFLADRQLGMRWVLTDRRLILPDGQRSVMLLEIATIRPMLGDVQLATRAGDKHQIKHVANVQAVVADITAARERRQRVKA